MNMKIWYTWTIVVNYLRTNYIKPEKYDLNNILFWLISSENLINKLIEFEELITQDALLENILSDSIEKYDQKYKGYTIKKLCQEINFFKNINFANLQKKFF